MIRIRKENKDYIAPDQFKWMIGDKRESKMCVKVLPTSISKGDGIITFSDDYWLGNGLFIETPQGDVIKITNT